MSSSRMPERLRQVQRTQSRKQSSRKARDKKMETMPDVPMTEIAHKAIERKPLDSRIKETISDLNTIEESTGQFEIVDYETASKFLDLTDQDGNPPASLPQRLAEPAEPTAVTAAPARENRQEPNPSSFEAQLETLRIENQQQVEKLVQAEMAKLQAMVHQQPALAKADETTGAKEDHSLSSPERQKYEDKIKALSKAGIKIEEQINILLDAQEQGMKYQSEMEARFKDAVAHIERERKARDESELNLRSEITEIRGLWQREKERTQKLMKTMAEMQNADPFKVDNDNIVSTVKELRYNIKNWVWAQRLILSLPAQGVISTYVTRAVGGPKDKGANYEFFSSVTPNWAEYTEKASDFRWLLQAYVWKRLVEILFYDDLWAGNRRPIDEDDKEYKLFSAYHALKTGLQPEEGSPEATVSQYHSWRSSTARILSQRITPQRQQHALAIVRSDILSPLIAATDGLPADSKQQILHPEDLDAIIESAMRLACTLAQQRANFAFEPVPVDMFGKVEFNKTWWRDGMAHLYGTEQYNPRTHMRVILLTLSPRLLKFGTSEGTGFDYCTHLLDGEVETGIVPRKIGRRPLGV